MIRSSLFVLFLLLSGSGFSQSKAPVPLFDQLYHAYPNYGEATIQHRRFSHTDVEPLVLSLRNKNGFSVKKAGESVEGRSIYMVSWGEGPVELLLWSQMHGDEPTATMALMDVFNFLVADDHFRDLREELRSKVRIHVLPLLNPDGAERYQRRNALGIDLNRDALRLVSPESRILRNAQDSIKPLFGYNLHDQSPYYTAGATGSSASVSFLAPAFNYDKDIDLVRLRSMQMIALLNRWLQEYIPGKVGRYNDDFEPRAFGDNIQKWGTSTMLFESGGLTGDPEKQELRRLHFAMILASFKAIAGEEYAKYTISDYEAIPENDRNLNDLLIRNGKIEFYGKPWTLDLAFRRNEITLRENRAHYHSASIADMGDLSTQQGYVELDAKGMLIEQGRIFDRILKDVKELEKIDTGELVANGVLYFRLYDLPSSGEESGYPVHFLGAAERIPYITLGQNPALQIREKGELRYVVVNGLLYSVGSGGIKAIEPVADGN